MKRIAPDTYAGKLTGGTEYVIKRIGSYNWQLEIADTIMLVAKHKRNLINYLQRLEGL